MSEPRFLSPITHPFGLTDVGFSASPTLTDIDGDGDLNALVGDSAGDTLFYRNTGGVIKPVFDNPTTNPFNLASLTGIDSSLINVADFITI